MSTETEKRAAFIEGLRQIADFLGTLAGTLVEDRRTRGRQL